MLGLSGAEGGGELGGSVSPTGNRGSPVCSIEKLFAGHPGFEGNVGGVLPKTVAG